MRRFTDLYGGHPVHLVVVLACFVVSAYAGSMLLGDPSLLPMLVWFVGAALVHDFLLFPLYALGDRGLGAVLRRTPRLPVAVVNHVRVPALGAGLTLLMFLPGIIRQGEATHLAATGLDQQPYLARWLWLTAALVTASAVLYLIRIVVSRFPEPTHRDRELTDDIA